jgi:hypothetical protein
MCASAQLTTQEVVEIARNLSYITWRTTVAYQSTEDTQCDVQLAA